MRHANLALEFAAANAGVSSVQTTVHVAGAWDRRA